MCEAFYLLVVLLIHHLDELGVALLVNPSDVDEF